MMPALYACVAFSWWLCYAPKKLLLYHDTIVLFVSRYLKGVEMSKAKSMRVVLTYGTFDIFHAGHVNILKRARELGDRLIVGVSTDQFNSLKGKKSLFSFEERKLIVESSKYVDFVIPENSWDQKITDVADYNVSTFVMGHDWTGKFDFLESSCDVVYLSRTPVISSSYYKDAIQAAAA